MSDSIVCTHVTHMPFLSIVTFGIVQMFTQTHFLYKSHVGIYMHFYMPIVSKYDHLSTCTHALAHMYFPSSIVYQCVGMCWHSFSHQILSHVSMWIYIHTHEISEKLHMLAYSYV